MTARIYKPAKTAMQSGKARIKEWVLEFEPESPREVEPLMGWTASRDMLQQVRLQFDTPEQAIAYCERHGVAYEVFRPEPTTSPTISYADNFSPTRREPWTH
jgi:ETC complex I subunit conserved region